jgi:putative dimethyl sulfoxide reductase chaperone
MTPLPSLTARSRHFLLASQVTGYPDRDLAETLVALREELRDHEGVGAMVAMLPDRLEDLQSTYVDLFDRGKRRVSLYETEHGRMRGLAKGNDLADLAGFYLAFGLTLDDTVHEMLDHVAIQLEFYGVLLLKQELVGGQADAEGERIVDRARRAFLADHLGRFVGVVAEQAAVAADPVYGPIFRWCARLVEAECADLGVTPAPLDFFADDRERESPDCGAVRLPVVG